MNYTTVFVFSIITEYWDGISSRNPALWKVMTCLRNIADDMVADDLAMQGARPSVAMVINYFSRIFWFQLQK